VIWWNVVAPGTEKMGSNGEERWARQVKIRLGGAGLAGKEEASVG
jgi:hypothetical protein